MTASRLTLQSARGASRSGLGGSLYAQQHANWNTTALTNTSGAVQEGDACWIDLQSYIDKQQQIRAELQQLLGL